MTRIVFETHSTSEDNEAGRASGWNHSRLSATGREQAEALGARRREDGIDAVFVSDLRRATETVQVAFGDAGPPVFVDWRLRECNYGTRNGAPAREMHAERADHLDVPYPGGESWRGAVTRAAAALRDAITLYADGRILVVGHISTRWACEHLFGGRPLEDLVAESFVWQEGWEYEVLGGSRA